MKEARIHLTLRLDQGRVAGLEVDSTRAFGVTRLLVGRRPAELALLVPTLFALCGTAQGLACAAALEDCLGLPPAQPLARRLLLLGETVSEHGLNLLLAGEKPDVEGARRLKAALGGLRKALYPAGDWATPGGGLLQPDRDSVRAIITEAQAILAPLLPQGDFHLWRTTGSARLLNRADGFGAGPFLPMLADGPADLAQRLAQGDEDYLARPDCGGQVPETGPLARHYRHPLLAALLDEFGNGVLTRLAARLVEIEACLHEMSGLVQDLTEAPAAALSFGDGSGLARVQAARGLLAHRVELEDGRVKRYQILAPTEWNFHPDGPLARGLLGARADDDLQSQAQLLVQALDPCVACSVSVAHA